MTLGVAFATLLRRAFCWEGIRSYKSFMFDIVVLDFRMLLKQFLLCCRCCICAVF